MTYYIFLESAGQNLANERYCNIPNISNASFGHERSGSPSPNGLFTFKYILGMVPIDMFFCLSAGGGGDKRSSYIILEHSINNIYIRKFKSPTWIVTKFILNVISSVF